MNNQLVKTILVVLVLARALAAAPDIRLPLPTKAEYARVTTILTQDGDSTAVSDAVDQIKKWIAGQRVSTDLAYKWGPALLAKQRYQDVSDIALSGLLMRPEPKFLDHLPPLRVRALNSLNKPAEALQAAKSFYNSCSMAQTSTAIDLLEVCLSKSCPADPDIGHRFRKDQVLAAGDNTATSQEVSAQPNESVLKSISIDPALYADALSFWKKKSASGKFNDMASYANLLLLSDRGAEAEKIFRELLKLAGSQDELDSATEGVAKSLRTEDGNVGLANAWLRSLQKSSEKPDANPTASSHLDRP